MSNITSSTYPVVTVSKAGDQFVIVQNGQLKKLTRGGLETLIRTLAPNTFIALTDAPGSYVGQAGKALVVNSTETGTVFEAATAGNFNALSDTPASKSGQAAKVVAVNTAETALEYIENTFSKLTDTPANFTGASKNIVRVNTAANALEYVTPTVAAPARNLTGGWFDVNHSGTVQNYTTTGTFVKVLNDAGGPNTRSDYAPPGITTIYSPTTSQFDLSQLEIGDWVTLRIDMTLETTAANEEVALNFVLNAGGVETTLAASRNAFKTAGTGKKITPEVTFYIGNAANRDGPAEVRFRADANANLTLQGYAVFIQRLGVF